MSRILVVGLPRSGTSWAEQTMRTAARTATVGEPDNEDNFPYAIKAKAGLGRYPVVPAGTPADDPAVAAYAELWDGAFRGGRDPRSPAGIAGTVLHRVAKQRTSVYTASGWAPWRRTALDAGVRWSRPCAGTRADHVVVKSVFAAFALPWICERWQPRVVVMTRSALNTVASWQRLDWPRPFAGHPVLGGDDVGDVLRRLLPTHPLPPTPPPADRLARLTWELTALMTMLRDVAERDPGSVVLRHEELCVDPVGRFREVFDRLGLRWTPRTEAYLVERDRPGSGAYDTARLAADEPTRWRRTLSAADAARITEVTARFGVAW